MVPTAITRYESNELFRHLAMRFSHDLEISTALKSTTALEFNGIYAYDMTCDTKSSRYWHVLAMVVL